MSHHPVGLENLMQVLCKTGAVVDHNSQLLHLQANIDLTVREGSQIEIIHNFSYLRESPPVHVGASNKHMLSINNPELAVQDAPRQTSKIHFPHLCSCRDGHPTEESSCHNAPGMKTYYIACSRSHIPTFLFQDL